MTLGNGQPCIRCGTSEWYDNGSCKACAKQWKIDNPEKAELLRIASRDNKRKKRNKKRPQEWYDYWDN